MMKTDKIKREVVALVMESPLYFTIPLRKRLDFIKFFSNQTIFNKIGNCNMSEMDKKCYIK